MQRNNNCLFSALLLLATSLAIPVITAADENSGWSHSVWGYLFAAGIDATGGVTTPGGAVEMPIDMDFNDILDSLDSAFSAIYIGRNGRFSILADVSYMKLEFDDTIAVPPPISATATVGVDFAVSFVELGGGYQISNDYAGLDVIGGVRYFDHDIDLNVTAGPAAVGRSFGADWIDPFVGLHYVGPINDKWDLLLRGDIGGFGVGSDFIWQARAGLRYHINKDWDVAVLYKYMDFDFQEGSPGDSDYYKYDSVESGVLLGVGYSF